MVGIKSDAIDQGPTPAKRYDQIGRPRKWPLPEVDFVWRAGELVAPVNWPSDMLTKTAFLGDFGLAIRAGSPVVDDAVPPYAFCAPELHHKGYSPSFGSDMWSYGCIFATVVLEFSPFVGWGIVGALDQTADVLGPMPHHWENSFKEPQDERLPRLYDQSRTPTNPLGGLIDHNMKHLVGTRERDLILNVLEKCFRYEPSERLSAEQLLEDASFLELMSIHGVEI